MGARLWRSASGLGRRLCAPLLKDAAERGAHRGDGQAAVDRVVEQRPFVDGVDVAAAHALLLYEPALLQVADDLVDGALGEIGAAGDLAQGRAGGLEKGG